MQKSNLVLIIMIRKFAASTWIWSPALGSSPTDDLALLEKISDFGFDGVELPSMDGYLNTDEIHELLSVVGKKSRPLTPIIIGGGSIDKDLSSESNPVRSQGMGYVKRLIDLSAKLDGELVCGPLYSCVGAKGTLSEKERARVRYLLIQEFKELGSYAKERSIRLALEPLCRYDTYLINTAAQGRELVDLIGSENVGLLLDTFHLNIEEKSVEGAITHSGEKLFHFHACENDRGAPGTGLIRWEDVRKGLDTVNYRRMISIESFVPEARPFSAAMHVWRSVEKNQDEIANRGLAFLRNLLGS
jgi:D-psicose/D-tagatose/L-ribulose 3-epimerase